MASLVPDGMVVFFTSYTYMEHVVATWYDQVRNGAGARRDGLENDNGSGLRGSFCFNYEATVMELLEGPTTDR